MPTKWDYMGGLIIALLCAVLCAVLLRYAEHRDETERAGREDCTQVDERTRLCGMPDWYWRYGK